MVSIRKANKNDSLNIANIHFISWGVAYVELLSDAYISQNNNLAAKITLWQEIIAHPDVTIWLAYDSSNENQHSVGFIGYFNQGDNYEITTLYVLPEYHNLGIGSALMNSASKDILDANNNRNLYLWVLETNVSAINFYKKHGFVASGESSEELYEDTKIVDIKMTKSLV